MLNKRGSVTIFVMMFMVTLISLFMLMIRESKNAAVKGAFSSLSVMWCDSILAEYDLNLQGRYDIFAFYGLAPDVNSKLRFYAGESILKKKYVSMSEIDTSLYDHSLNNTDVFREQIVRAAELRIAGDLMGKEGEYESHGPSQPRTTDAGALMSDLPSGGSSRSVSVEGFRRAVENTGSIKDIIVKTGEKYLENRYAFSYFKDHSDDRDLGRTFLNYEIEYLISGRKSDAENEDSIRLKIIGIRTIFNTLFAFRDEKMIAETLAAAEVLTPGAMVPVTQALLQTGWAACESINDYNLLINGKKVPLYKDSGSWALDLESIVKGGIKEQKRTGADDSPEAGADNAEYSEPELKEEVPCVDSGNEHGETYHDYLSTMLYLMDENVMLLRMMDLIQINMRYCSYADFRIRDYNTGLRTRFVVNGREYEVERSY